MVELNDRLGSHRSKKALAIFLAQYFKDAAQSYGESGGADINPRLHQMRGNAEDKMPTFEHCFPRRRNEIQPGVSACRGADVDHFFMAMEVMLCHQDGYTYATHNYRIYHDLDTGKMVFFPHDMDQMIGEAGLPITVRSGASVPRAVMRSAEGRTRYRERFSYLFTNVFQPSSLTARIDQYVSGVAPALREHSPRLAAEFQAGARNLKERIRNRAAGIEKQLMPAKPLVFDNEVAQIQTWRKHNRQENAAMSEVSADGRQALKISCEDGPCTASWRTTVLLDPGRYRFSGRARLTGVLPRTDIPKSGVFLREAHSQRNAGFSADTDWKSLHQEFSIEENQRETVLVCEFVALKGEVLFDKDSLRLERLP
jgi:hypothetical protein